jgi:hypothetical protein
MTLARKGSRAIVVGGVGYRFKISRWRKVSDWKPADAGLVDERWLEQARRFGLGDVANVRFGIAVELAERPVSKIIAGYHALVVDGFLGIEQFTRIGPSLIATVVEHALARGWKPSERGDFRLEIVENTTKPGRPALLVLAGLTEDDASYEPRVVPVRIL